MEPLVPKEILFPRNLWGGIVHTNDLVLSEACGVDLLFPGCACYATFSGGNGCTCTTLEVIVDAIYDINPPMHDVEFIRVYCEAHITVTIQL